MKFGSTPETGCPNDSFSIKTLLQTRKETDKSTWVLFVDLIKAFDSINHELLFKLLEKFGIPDRVIMVIKNLYKILKTKLTVEKCVNFVDYSTGVKACSKSRWDFMSHWPDKILFSLDWYINI